MYFSVLDLLVLVFAAFAAVALAAVSLMFFLKNKTAKKVAFFAACGYGALLAAVSLYIAFTGMLALDIVIGVLGALFVVGALVWQLVGKKRKSSFVFARLCCVAGLVLSIYNLFLW